MPELKDHPLALAFPPMPDEEFAEFKADVSKRGLLDPGVLYQGMVLDGRHRRRACDELKVEFRTTEYTGDDPVGFVASKNIRRRHMDTSQRAMSAAKIAEWQRGQSTAPTTQAEAAAAMNVSERSVSSASKVLRDGIPELAEAVQSGKASISAAAVVSSLPVEQQQSAVKNGTVAEVAKSVKDADDDKKRRSIACDLVAIHDATTAQQFRGDPFISLPEIEAHLETLPPFCGKCFKLGPRANCKFCEDVRKLARLEAKPPSRERPEPKDEKPEAVPTNPDNDDVDENLWAKAYFAKEIQAVINATKLITKAVRGDAVENQKALAYFSACGLLDFPQGRIQVLQEGEVKEKKGGVDAVVFACLKGVSMLLRKASEVGPILADHKIKKEYEEACLGKPFLPLLHAKKRNGGK